ncbi:large subunit ribosomal protein L24 [Nitrosomonas marina]|uniref:Large ribosomal subunit protein uL24 n=1 Tax=Nitrosomonas marina TaxID=917 RepID=A0A1I0EW99_9PROT|nr:50S ribosomal protein L24 [Nitrosomonas marina]SET49764.1 large subunit ribosomal protein L24 [Nitrosomonas marina]
MKKVRKGDDVVILAGKDKGKRGTVIKVLCNEKVQVQGVNIVKKHQKPNPSTGATGGIVNIDKPIHISNVALYNATTKKSDRVGFQLDKEQNKVRIYKSSGELV